MEHHSVRDLLTPSLVGTSLYIFATIIVLVASVLTHFINSVTATATTYNINFDVAGLFHQYIDTTFGQLNQSELIGKVTVYLVWAGLGALVYIVIWIVINSYVSVRNDLVVGLTFTSGAAQGNSRYWTMLMERGGLRIAAVLLILLLTSVTIQVWYPFSISLFHTWYEDFSVPFHWLMLFESVLGWFVIWHASIILMRLCLLRTRVLA